LIECIKDDTGNLKAVCSYVIINREEKIDYTDGQFILIEEMEINPEYRHNGIVMGFIRTLLNKYPKLEVCLFVREYKYPGRPVRFYTRKQFELLTKRG
jgi:hypothetical protein